ncbi:MAG: M23 family metallopeptidase [Bacteroidaceae bacterium]|nr:M23 family metallopeptidase [Bacteroidaceae bacterium]
MKYFVALFILINTCLHTKAQFHTIASRPLQYKVEILKDRPKSETVNVKDSLAMVGKKEESIDREKWLERYMRVSLPLKSIKVTSPFGMRKDPFTGKHKMHNGIDLHAHNDEVYAMFSGMVKMVGYDNRSGKYVILQHDGLTVIYCHLSKVTVKEKTPVLAGDVIGITGNTGRSTGEHLHLSCKIKEKFLNPHKIIEYIMYSLL